MPCTKTTYRFFVNNKRLATAVVWNYSESIQKILEVFPKPKEFGLCYNTEAEWRAHCERDYVPKYITRVEVSAPTPVANPEPTPKKKPWICPVCFKGPGNDHRMCICIGFNYSVARWEEACGIRSPEINN
jgi:hypothetical protein